MKKDCTTCKHGELEIEEKPCSHCCYHQRGFSKWEQLEPVNHILCAAIWYDDGKKRSHMPKNIDTGIVVCGHRHCNCFIILNSIFPECDYKYEEKTEQGFLTSEGNFVTRKQAGVIAYNAGQIIEQTETLFSEDLY